jgi:hypothetical protein
MGWGFRFQATNDLVNAVSHGDTLFHSSPRDTHSGIQMGGRLPEKANKKATKLLNAYRHNHCWHCDKIIVC